MKLSVLIGTLAFGLSAFAQDPGDISLGMPGYGGTGCPAGSASVTLSPDAKQLSIIFDEFLVETSKRRRIARKNCNIAIPVHVPQGYSVSVIKVDYRGYVSLPRGGRARLTSEYFIAGQRGPRYTKHFRGYTDQDYTFGNQVGIRGMIWSACGKSVNLRVNTSMLVRSKKEALATVDSADFDAGLIYHFKWKRCRR